MVQDLVLDIFTWQGIPPRCSWCLSVPAVCWDLHPALAQWEQAERFLSSKLGVWDGESALSLCHFVPSKITQFNSPFVSKGVDSWEQTRLSECWSPHFSIPVLTRRMMLLFPYSASRSMGWDVSRRNPTDPPIAIGRVIHRQILVIPLSHVCPPCLGAALGWGTLAAAHRHCSSFAPESFSSYFWVATAFPNICFGVGAWPCSQLGLPACSLLC